MPHREGQIGFAPNLIPAGLTASVPEPMRRLEVPVAVVYCKETEMNTLGDQASQQIAEEVVESAERGMAGRERDLEFLIPGVPQVGAGGLGRKLTGQDPQALGVGLTQRGGVGPKDRCPNLISCAGEHCLCHD